MLPPRTPSPGPGTVSDLHFHARGLHLQGQSPRYVRSSSPTRGRGSITQAPMSSLLLQQALGMNLQQDSPATVALQKKRAHEDEETLSPCLTPTAPTRPRSITMRRQSAQEVELSEIAQRTTSDPRDDRAHLTSADGRNDYDQLETLSAGLQAAFCFELRPGPNTILHPPPAGKRARTTPSARASLDNNARAASISVSPVRFPSPIDPAQRRATISQAPDTLHAERPPYLPPHHGQLPELTATQQHRPQFLGPPSSGFHFTGASIAAFGDRRSPHASDGMESDSSSELELEAIVERNCAAGSPFRVRIAQQQQQQQQAAAANLGTSPSSNDPPKSYSPSCSTHSSPASSSRTFSPSVPAYSSEWDTDSEASVGAGTESPFL
ncbi:hypothetical protein V8E36_004801 [Tilletia maclaganii]